MIEPFFVFASIAGLITLADIIFGRTYAYAKAIKGASKDIAAFSSEIGDLYGILQRLNLVACQFEGELFDSTARTRHVHSCYQTLEKIRVRLGKDDASGLEIQRFEKMKRKPRWPFTSSEVKVLISEILRHKQTLGLALNVDSMSALVETLSMQHELHNPVGNIKTFIKNKHESETRIALSNERQRVLKSFNKVDPRKSSNISWKLRHPGTGLWLTEGTEFQSWLNVVNPRLWLYGIPGASKTVLAAAVTDEALQSSSSSVAVAFFYCDYTDTATHKLHIILSSLAYQIARQDEQSFQKLHQFYKTHNPEQRDDIEYDLGSLRDLVLDLTSSFNHAMVIVDALDECGSNAAQVSDVLTSLSDCNHWQLQ